MSIYKGTELLAGVATDTISNANYLLDFKWSDHIINSMEWLRADTFSWQNGDVYKATYNHILADYNGGTSTTETVGSYTITYVLATDGHKITTDEATVLNIYNATGVAWYYVLDTTNTRFKLPRTKYGFTGLRDTVGNYLPESLPNIKGYAGINSAETPSGAFYPLDNDIFNGIVATSQGTGRRTSFNASRSSSTYQDSAPVQQRATQMYLYFYVGQFSQTATEQTAGLNASLFNGKVDLDAANLSTAGKSLISGLGMPSNRYTDLTLLASGNTYIAPANGYYFLQKNGNANQFMEMTSSIKIRTHTPNYNGGNATIVLPVKKGTVVTISYDVSGSTIYFRFIYADGDS